MRRVGPERRVEFPYRPRRLPEYRSHNVQLPITLLDRLQRAAARRGVARSVIVRELLEKELPQ